MKTITLSIISCILAISVSAQVNHKPGLIGQNVSAFIIKTTGDTITGKIAYEEYFIKQTNITFTEDGAASSTIYQPTDIIGFGIDNNIWLSTAKTNFKTDDGIDYFVAIEILGPITKYVYYIFDKEIGVWKTRELIKKLDEDVILSGNMLLGFKKKMSKYVSDYEEMSDKIAGKEKGYKVMAFNKIVKEYNKWYLESNTFTVFNISEETSTSVSAKEPTAPTSWSDVQEFEGVKVKVSNCYRKEPTWPNYDEEDVEIAIDLNIQSKAKESFQQIIIEYKMLDADGKVIKEAKSFVGFPSFTPKPETAIEPGYKGTVKAWRSEGDENFKQNWKSTTFKVVGLK